MKVNITINRNYLITEKLEERMLIINKKPFTNNINNSIINDSYALTDYFEFYLNIDKKFILDLEDKDLRYLLLHANTEQIPISFVYLNEIKDLNTALRNFINYLVNTYTESEYIFKYIPEPNFLNSHLLIENAMLLYNNNLGALIYGYNQNINNELYIKLDNISRNIININRYYSNIATVIELIKIRMHYGFSKPFTEELLGYKKDYFKGNNHIGFFYNTKEFLSVLEYEHIMSAIISFKHLLYRTLVLYKHNFITYLADMLNNVNGLIDEYLSPIINTHNIDYIIDEDKNIFILYIILEFKKPNIVVNINITLNLGA